MIKLNSQRKGAAFIEYIILVMLVLGMATAGGVFINKKFKASTDENDQIESLVTE